MRYSSKINHNLLAIIACLLWSTAFVGIKIGLAHTTPLNFAGLRFFLAGLLVLPFTGPPAETFRLAVQHRVFILKIALSATSLVYGLFYTGISLGTASTTAIVVGGGPIFIAIMAHILIPNEKFTVKKGLSLAIGITGIAMIALNRYVGEAHHHGEFWSVFLLLGCNISGGYSNILISRADRNIPPLTLSALQLILGGFILFILSLLVEPIDLSPKPLPYYGALLYLSLLSATAMTLWFVVLRRPGVKVSEINIWKFIIPVLGAILSWTALKNESPDISQLVGMGAIAVALILMYGPWNLQSRRKRKPFKDA